MLYGVDQQLLDAGATPVLVEGPLDALAVTSAGRGRYLGVAPLGTSLTETQARLLATLHPEPIVATDADPAGRAAAERAYWLLTQHAVSPRSVALPDGSDPADILHRYGPEALAASVNGAHPLAQDLIDGRLAHTSRPTSVKDLAAVIAADAPSRWLTQARDLTERTDAKSAQILTDLAEATQRWNRQPSLTAQQQLSAATDHRVAQAPGAVSQPDSAAVGEVPSREAPPTTGASADGPPQNPHPGRRLAERGQWPKPSQTNRRSIER